MSNESDVVTTTKKKTKLLFKTHFFSFFTMILNDIVNFDYVNLILDDELLTIQEVKRVIKKRLRTKSQILMTFLIEWFVARWDWRVNKFARCSNVAFATRCNQFTLNESQRFCCENQTTKITRVLSRINRLHY